MNIWQLFLILLISIQFGAGLLKNIKENNHTGIVACVATYILMLFLYYKAGVLQL